MAHGFRYIKVAPADTASLAVEILSAELDLALAKQGTARIMLSGGGSPKPVYEALCEAALDWTQVAIGLVDERWVQESHAASNTAMIRRALIQNKASVATLVPMVTEDNTALEGADEIAALYLSLGQPFDICVMGMGTDGHTASWFPDSPDLSAALDLDNTRLVMAVDARACDGAGEIKERITLTRPAVLGARIIILYIPGAAKRAVFETAISNYENGDITTLPVASLLDAGERLIVITSDET